MDAKRESQVTVCLGNNRWPTCKFNIGDVVESDWAGKQVVSGITIYPETSYVFAYWLSPFNEESKTIGHDIPEDELGEVTTTYDCTELPD